MADMNDPPPLFSSEGDLNSKEDDDIFASTVEHKNFREGPMEGPAVEEVNLDEDEPQTQAPLLGSAKLEFRGSDEELSAPNPPRGATTLFSPDAGAKPQTGGKEKEKPEELLEISVREPQKVGEGMGAFVSYRVVTRTNLSYFRKSQMSVSRRFSDFLGLHEKLVEKHLHLGRIVPPVPEKSVLGMTKIKMSKDEGVASEDFVERRRAALERFLQRTAQHPSLRVDPDFREFLELEAELPRATSTAALSGAGMFRLISRVGDSVSKITTKMDETDPWFEEKQQQVDNLDLQLRRLHASIETMVQQRRELSQSTGSFAKSAAMLGNCEEHTGLSRALSKLAEVCERVEQVQGRQAKQDFYCLAELVKDYVSLVGAIKEALHQRVKVYGTWQHAQQTLARKREAKAKLELAQKADRLPQARQEVLDWEAKVDRAQEEFDSVSRVIRAELDRFELDRIADFRASVVRYLEFLLDTQQQLIKYWETFLPEAKAIA
ncbi:sorting nexin-2 isoform X2 [Ixodes scapularis]|uniref:sorting nexin-2 isoform X2 n=1 Tax=Ixodes scapularis TaxID=6945 RepID=UPI0011616C62|nr:sorting nexin-2 isoform X2 [Ixodes scapularis]